MKTQISLRIAAVFPLFIISFFSLLFLFSACDKTTPQQPPQPPTPPPTPIESGRDLWNRLEKEDPDKLIDYDFTDEQIEQIKRDFRIEKGSDPSLPEKKIDLNGNLLFFRGIVFSGVISVRQSNDFIYINDFRFSLTKIIPSPTTAKRGNILSENFAAFKNNKCFNDSWGLEWKINEAISEILQDSSLSLRQQELKLKGLLKNIDAHYHEIEVTNEGITVCFEKLPCNEGDCCTQNRSTGGSDNKRPLSGRDDQEGGAKQFVHTQIEKMLATITNSTLKEVYFFDNGYNKAGCAMEKAINILKEISFSISEPVEFDKYLLMSLGTTSRKCAKVDNRVEFYIFANPEYFTESVYKSFGGNR